MAKLKVSKRKKNYGRIAKNAVYVTIFLVIFGILGLKVYTETELSMQTELLGIDTVYDNFISDGLFVRDERIILKGEEGAVYYLADDGEKVEVGAKVASLYNSDADVASWAKIKSIEDQIAILQDAQNATGLVATDPVALESLIYEGIMKLTQTREKPGNESVEDIQSELITLQHRQKLSLGEIENFDAEINDLSMKKQEIQSGMGQKISDIETPISGYFTSVVDGYESILTPSSIEGMSALEINSLLMLKNRGSAPEDAIGKIFSDFNWYFVTVMPEEQAKKLSEMKSIKAVFPYVSDQELTLSIVSLSLPEDGFVRISLKGDIILKEFNLMRYQTVELRYTSYTGIKVPKSALRIVDGETGVYVVVGPQARFRTVDIIYETENFVIVKQDESQGSKSQLRSDDEVITKAKDLYHGKIVV